MSYLKRMQLKTRIKIVIPVIAILELVLIAGGASCILFVTRRMKK
jgi:hypothetical protein